MRNGIISLLFLLLSFALHAQEIAVSLRTDEDLAPTYICSFQGKSSFPKEHLAKLEKILRADFALNGKVRILKETKEREKIALQENNWKSFTQKRWQEEGALYVIKLTIEKNILAASGYCTQNQQIIGVEGIELTGEMLDGQKIHTLADQFFEAFFATKGIASSHILYTITKKDSTDPSSWKTDVWESNLDGTQAKKITQEKHLCVTPLYIPPSNGKKANAFLYVSYAIGQPKLYVASLANGETKRLTYLPGNQITPAISSKADKVAFVCDATGNPELFFFPFSLEKGVLAKPRLIFSSLAGAQGCPSFSPDGEMIAFVSNKDGKPRVYVMPIPQQGEGSAHMLTKKNSNNTSPSWSPDGTKLAYSASSGGTRQIWIYDFQTKKEWQLTEGNEHKENPSWASNSFHLIYNTSTAEGGELYVINLADKKPIKIVTVAGEKRFPSFSP